MKSRVDNALLRDFLQAQMPAALAWLRQMVEINSYTANRAGVNRLSRLTTECFAPLGFTAESTPSVNPQFGDHLALSRSGRSGRSLALISHLDTVFPPEEEERHQFRWQPDGDRIYGPGTHDIKGGTVMIWLTLSALQALAPSVFEDLNWRVLLNSSEETLSQDFGALCRRLIPRDALAALVFESEGRMGETRLVVVARKGRATWRISVSGRGAHAGGKHRHGANAVVGLANLLGRIDAMTDYSRDLTFNVATLTGGTVLNRVPHAAVAEGELRAFRPEVYADAKTALLNLAGPIQPASSIDRFSCQATVEILTESRPWPRNPSTDALAQVWQEIGPAVGLEVQTEERGGLSDGNFLWDFIPTLDGLGPAGDNDHCSERSADGSKVPEYVDVTSFVPKAVLNVQALLRLWETKR